MSEKNKVAHGFAWRFAERITSQGMAFIISVLLARLLEPSEFGVVAMIQVFITLSDIFITGGITSALIQKKDADDLDFSTILYCNLSISALLYALLFVFAPAIATFYKMPELVKLVRVYSLILLLFGYNSVQVAWVSRHMVFRKFFISTASATFVSGIIGVAMAFAGFGVWALIAQTMSKTLINMMVMRHIIDWRPKLVFSWTRAKSLGTYGINILATHLLGTGCNEIRQLLIGKLYSPGDLAFYNRGHHFPRLFTSNIDASLNSVLFPAMSNHSDDPVRIKAMTRRAMRTSSFFLFFALTTLAVCSRPLVSILLTDKWLPCVPYMQLMCIGSMLASVSTANLQAIKALGRSDVALKLELVKKPVFLLMIVVAANISVMALAVSVPLYSLYAALVNMRPNKKFLGYGYWEQFRDYLPATALSMAMCAVACTTSLLSCNMAVLLASRLAICFGTYLGLAALFKVETLEYAMSFWRDKRLRRRARA